MTDVQFLKLIEILGKITNGLDRKYTITGAEDWEIIALMFTGLFIFGGIAWRNIVSVVKENKVDWRRELREHKIDSREEFDSYRKYIKGEFDKVHKKQRECWSDCCKEKT